MHVSQELEHALTLARHRTAQLERYRDRLVQADQIGLPHVAEGLAPLLQQTQEHARDRRAALG